MNDNEAKVPNVEFGWDAIDIYLFSNGQKYSPPRKYHLRANDLDWWDATLNHLAKLHFGSLHSAIELYTIHGDKVESPVELSDGAPYVAVVPPDTFMDTGYEKYLLKASRSWEKRKAKKASIEAAAKVAGELVKEEHLRKNAPEAHGHSENLAVSWSKAGPEIYQTESPKQWSSQLTDETSCKSELTTIKMPDEMHLAVSSVMVKPQKTVSDVVDNPPPKKIIISTPTSNGRNGKKHMPGQHTSFVKAGTVTTSPWKNNIKKRDFQKKVLTKIPIKMDPVPGMSMKPTYVKKYHHESTDLPPNLLPPTKTQTPKSLPPKTALVPTTDSTGRELPSTSSPKPPTPAPTRAGTEPSGSFPPPAPLLPSLSTIAHLIEATAPGMTLSPFVSTLPSIPTTPTKCRTMISLHSRGLVTDKDLIADKGLITDDTSMQNVIGDKELLVVTTDGYAYKKVENKMITVNKERETTISVEEETQTHIDVSTCEVNTMISKHVAYNNVKVIPAAIVSQTNIMNCDIPLGDNCIAVINKGDAVNLNLNIELPNEESLHINNHSNVSIPNPHVRKVSSLTNIHKMKKPAMSIDETDKNELPTKSLESLIYNINECYANVVVVQCACCGNNTTVPRIDAMPVYKDNNGFFILMPSPGQQENSNCMCCSVNQKRPDKRGVSALCLELCKPHSSTVFPCVQQDMGMMTTVADSSQTEKYLKTICNMCMMDQGPMYKGLSFNSDRCERCNSCTSDSQVLEKIEIFVSESNVQKPLPVVNCKPLCNCMDAYAQTDWCGVLLQAKRHEDGRFSFHLPPLNVLKCYALV